MPKATSVNKNTSISANISASSITSGLGPGEANAYYDRNGNRIPENTLE